MKRQGHENILFDAGALTLLLVGDERLSSYVNETSSGLAKAYRETAETWYFRVLNSNVVVVSADATLAREVGIYKSRHRRLLSLADCFAMALTVKEKATLLTTDSDFTEVKEVEAKYFPI